jgi:hypothetical protein
MGGLFGSLKTFAKIDKTEYPQIMEGKEMDVVL